MYVRILLKKYIVHTVLHCTLLVYQLFSVKAAPSTIRVPSFNKADNKQPTVTTVRVPSFNKAPDKKPKGIPTNKLPSSNLSEQEVYVESDQNDYTPQGYTYVVKESQQNEDDGDEEIYTDMD